MNTIERVQVPAFRPFPIGREGNRDVAAAVRRGRECWGGDPGYGIAALFLLAFGFCVVRGEARQPDVHLAGELQTHHEVAAFSGSPIEVTFQFIAADEGPLEFSSDFYQEAGSLAARLTPEVQTIVEEPVSNAVVREVRFALELPEVERQTRFLFRMKVRQLDSASWEVVGKTSFRVHPLLDWEKLRHLSGDIPISSKAEGTISAFLEDAGIEIFLHESSGPAGGLILWETAVTDQNPPEVASRGQVILVFRCAGDEMLRIEHRPAGGGKITEIFPGLPKDPATDPRSAIILYEIIESAFAEVAANTQAKRRN